MKKPKIGECIYCGNSGPLTLDHIPPKCLFGTPRPELVKVPSCRVCNNMASNDDEYFKATLSLRYDLGEHKDILKIRPATLRAFEKPAKKQFRTAILSTLRQSTIFGPDGQALRSYNVRLERLYRVVRRIACGLFFDQTGQRLDPAYGTGVLGDEELSTLDKRFRDEFLGYLARARTAVYGDNVFSFRGFRNAEDRMMTGWQFHFYGKIEFIAATLPLQVLETEESLGD